MIELCNSGKLTEGIRDWVGYNAAAFCSAAALEACVNSGFPLDGYSYEDTPLMTAAQYNNIENVRWILERKASDGDGTDYRFRTLKTAIAYDHDELSAYMLEIGTPFMLNDQTSISDNILREASSNGNADIIQQILRHSGQPIAKVILLDAIHDAIRWEHYDVIEPLLQAGEFISNDLWENTTLAVKHLDTLKLLERYGANMNDESVMMYAVECGYYDTVRYLIENGCAIDFYSNELGSPIQKAVGNGLIDIAALLIANGANVNETSDQFGSVLIVAAKSSRNMTQLLLDNGADVDYQAGSGSTALMDAARKGRADVVKILLAAGADTTLTNKDGQTALDIAAEAGYPDIVSMLEQNE